MATALEAAIPPAKPAFELIDDRLCQKVNPKYDHGRLQFIIAALIWDWARDRGRVATEWRFTLDLPAGQASLVPDVAYLSFERLPLDRKVEAQEPHMAPDVAIEILSPGDWRQQVDRKAELYLSAGTRLVIEVDPQQRTLTSRDVNGSVTCETGEFFEHPAMPGFSLDLAEVFAALDR